MFNGLTEATLMKIELVACFAEATAALVLSVFALLALHGLAFDRARRPTMSEQLAEALAFVQSFDSDKSGGDVVAGSPGRVAGTERGQAFE